MNNPLAEKLLPIVRRQRLVALLRHVTLGFLASSLLAIATGSVLRFVGSPISFWLATAILSVGPLFGLLFALSRRRDWYAAAVAIDRHYRLKDRCRTALSFLSGSTPTVYQRLQVRDALRHVNQLEPVRVIPVALPKFFPYASAALLLAVAIFAWPAASPTLEAGPRAPIPEIVKEAEHLAEGLKELAELAEEEEDRELSALLAQFSQKIEQMKQTGLDAQTALSLVSEMEQLMEEALMREEDLELVEEHLENVGQAMSSAEALRGPATALRQRRFHEATRELEQIQDPQIERHEAERVERDMNRAAGEMKDARLSQLRQATGEMAQGVKAAAQRTTKSKAQFKQDSQALTKQLKKHVRKKRISMLIAKEQRRLGDCKSLIRNLFKNMKRSRAGKGGGGNRQGKKTENEVTQERVEVELNAGQGSSEVESSRTEEARAKASRIDSETYQEFRRMSEAVLDGEPIPMGYRESIRRYFEAIRPTGAEVQAPE